MIDSVETLKQRAEALKKESPAATRILISMGTCGIAAGAVPVLEELKRVLAEKQLEDKVEIVEAGCIGQCYAEPSVEIYNTESGENTIYGDVKVRDVDSIINHISDAAAGITTVQKTWYYPEIEKNTGKKIQARIVLRNSGRIDPEKLEDYLKNDGYQALGKVLTGMTPEDVIKEITEAGLRGRGGGGFPTGMKWNFAAQQPAGQKYMICNADEGDPGAFMDRAVLEGDPHAVLEAMAIGGYAIGADTGIIYIRAEYPLAVKRLKIAIKQAEENGLLGDNIFGSGFNFKILLKYGAGAFVCGEETALIHSIEGKRGEPTFKPPFPAVSGLWGKPTVVNNVETYANVPAIIRSGAKWFRTIGTEKSPGTKVFALAGKVENVGLVEVPMGTKLRDIIFSLGGGIKDGKEFKAVQTGGPSGGCLKHDRLETGIDYESLAAIGSMMGSGGMIVMDEDDCMVNVAKFFLDFTLDESCGKCTPCRIGNTRLHEMLERICEGKATPDTITKLKNLSYAIKDTALCGLGQTSPNPVLSTLANFEDEYLAHINDKRCPAGVCSKLITFTINDNCVGCTLCARNCPVSCISGERKEKHHIDQEKCIKCGVCYEACKFHAIDKI